MALDQVSSSAVERLPPHNVDAEESVLGSVLIDREAIGRVAATLRPEDFYRERNATIYAAMLALYERGEPVDYLTLADELQRMGKYEAVGGLPYLAQLLVAVPTSVHIEHYARIVERTAVMRRLISVAGEIARIGFQDTYDVDAAVAEAAQKVLAVGQRRAGRDFKPLRDVLTEYFEQLQALAAGEGSRYGVPTGFIDLDKITGGLQRSDLVLLAARPSVGKTSLALCLAANAAVRFHMTTAIFSLEMSNAQIAARLLSMESGIDSARLRQGQLNQPELRKLHHALTVLADAPIFLDDTPAIPITQLRLKAERLHLETHLDLIIVDYLQLVTAGKGENRVNEISEISRSLKRLARDLNVPVVALSQLSRAVESRSPHIPMLSDLRESGSLEQDADVVLFIYREDVYNKETEKKGIAEIHIAKHRNGPTGVVNLLFQERTTKFVDLEPFRE
jgi:replicative DNA helicase